MFEKHEIEKLTRLADAVKVKDGEFPVPPRVSGGYDADNIFKLLDKAEDAMSKGANAYASSVLKQAKDKYDVYRDLEIEFRIFVNKFQKALNESKTRITNLENKLR